jgi:hypothetical protein
MRRFITIGLGILLLSAFTAQDASAYTVVPIKTTAAVEDYPQAVTFGGHSYFAWTQWAKTSSRTGVIWVETDGGAPKRVNDPKTLAFTTGIDPTTGTLIYQQTPSRSGDSNLYTYDLTTGVSTLIPSVNSPYWDCCADMQGSEVLYETNQFSSKRSPWKIFLYDTGTHTRTTLDHSTYGCACLISGNIDGDYLTWTKGAHVYVWNIATQTRVAKLSPPRGKYDYNPFIVDPTPGSPGDETLYWTKSGYACGSHVSFYEAPLAHLGNTTKVLSLPSGKDTFSMNVDSSAGENDLYFGRVSCKSGTSNIYEIPNV